MHGENLIESPRRKKGVVGPGQLNAHEQRLDAAAWSPILKAALEDLPARQRQVVLLRDVDELSSEEVCSVLAISDGNQRVLLHRGRSRLRQLFEDEFREVR